MCCSLELAGLAQQTPLSGEGVVYKQLYENTAKKGVKVLGFEKDEKQDKRFYRFPIKSGAYQAKLCRLMLAKSSGMSSTEPTAQTGKYILPIAPDDYPRLPPSYIEPTDEDGKVVVTPKDYDDITNERLCVLDALVDPFSPVHAYLGILPVKELVLPNWTWQGSMDRLSAFFHMGPILTTGDVPDFDEGRELVQGALLPKVVKKAETKIDKPEDNGVGLPGGALEQWAWLQLYMTEVVPPKEEEGHVDLMEKYMPLAIDLVDERARLQQGWYTAVEGYLQMAAGAVKEKEEKPKI
ncbi:hypothetical protein CTA2_8588 [Colletotrichum tanaceti]|uniref:Uncharacterized protein n=1 Tax=Colletotrichum tanaceti TaxID=1306861 RepID=A0A4U6XG17_9PEZI|nr:hypothetical protein CTA2_8588 [Colletotrichum tanaceti]TKW54820.1 hypothetical protein CTA1_5135 [Colletotrichum tanaceti]